MSVVEECIHKLIIAKERRGNICESHGVSLIEREIFNGSTIKYCPLCEKENIEKNQSKEEEQKKENFKRRMKNCNVELEFWNKDFSDYEIKTESQKKALEAIKEMVEKEKGKVILLGSNGVGKTMLGSIAVKKLGGKILSMYEISTMIRQSYSPRGEKTELEITSELASIPLLVIDELGRTKGSDAELNWLSYILDKRHVRKLPFVLLSNTHLKRDCKKKGCDQCFEAYVNNDVISRLRQDSKIITLIGKDYRIEEDKNDRHE